jgi:multiple sugar transport system substrate-binding protein
MVATAQRFSELNPGAEVVWEKRSLQEFADQPIDQLAERYDLLVIDHPWAGFASAAGLLIPLDDHLPAQFLAEQASNSVGPSHASYSFGGHQWAFAIDAAAPVASWRSDLLPASDLPRTWDHLLELARAGMVLMPGIPVDTLMTFYMLCSTLGEDVCQDDEHVVSPQVGMQALGMLRELALLLDPFFWELNPVRVYEAMTLTDRYAYCPFAYGYSNYSRLGYARALLDFGDMIEIEGRRCRTTLGGAGLGISSGCAHREIALDYAAFVADPVCQRTLYTDSGGQPAHRLAWTDERVNKVCRDFFRNTLPALDRAFLRPRYPGYLYFQNRAGTSIRDYMRAGGGERALLANLDRLYRESRKGGQP